MPLYGLPVCNSVLTWVWLVTAVQGGTVGPSEARRLQTQTNKKESLLSITPLTTGYTLYLMTIVKLPFII